MKLKIYYRSSVVWNIFLLLILSLLFIYFQYSSMNSDSVMSMHQLDKFLMSHVGIVVVFGWTMFSFLNNYQSLGRKLLIVCVLITGGMSIANQFHEFSKLSLIVLFFYFLISYYLYQFYLIDATESYYSPLFTNDEFYEPKLTKVGVEIYRDDEKLTAGYLTNWSQEGCFVYVKQERLSRGKYTIKVNFLDREFLGEASLVSASKKLDAYGFKFILAPEKDKNVLGWNQFYEIIEQMGFDPELLR